VPVLRDTARSDFSVALRGGNCINVGLINNMPDAALEATEQQFAEVIGAASNNAVVRFTLFSISDLPRADHVRHELAQRYRDVSELWDTRLDGLIVTGAEPRAATLKGEPYWATLTKVIDWARENTVSTIWSCLAAHAAGLHADAIERHRLPKKQLGVFDCQVAAVDPMTQHLREPLRVPHSRYNDLAERPLACCGYKILTRSAVAGVDTFSKRERSLFLFFQGHPEYDAGTLLREYRRDIGRFLRGEQQHYPASPHGFFNAEQMAIANEFRDRVLVDRRNDLINSFPMSHLRLGLKSTWRNSSIRIYKKWIGYLRARQVEGRMLTLPLRQSWRDSPRRGSRRSREDRLRQINPPE
jgi:homoserine O-succinyltransferase/O-acetyltransferase